MSIKTVKEILTGRDPCLCVFGDNVAQSRIRPCTELKFIATVSGKVDQLHLELGGIINVDPFLVLTNCRRDSMFI